MMAIVMTMGTLTAAYAEDGGYAQTSQTLNVYGEAAAEEELAESTIEIKGIEGCSSLTEFSIRQNLSADEENPTTAKVFIAVAPDEEGNTVDPNKIIAYIKNAKGEIDAGMNVLVGEYSMSNTNDGSAEVTDEDGAPEGTTHVITVTINDYVPTSNNYTLCVGLKGEKLHELPISVTEPFSFKETKIGKTKYTFEADDPSTAEVEKTEISITDASLAKYIYLGYNGDLDDDEAVRVDYTNIDSVASVTGLGSRLRVKGLTDGTFGIKVADNNATPDDTSDDKTYYIDIVFDIDIKVGEVYRYSNVDEHRVTCSDESITLPVYWGTATMVRTLEDIATAELSADGKYVTITSVSKYNDVDVRIIGDDGGVYTINIMFTSKPVGFFSDEALTEEIDEVSDIWTSGGNRFDQTGRTSYKTASSIQMFIPHIPTPILTVLTKQSRAR